MHIRVVVQFVLDPPEFMADGWIRCRSERDELCAVGERAWNLKRVINHRLGLTRANDRLPKPLLQPLPDGGAAGSMIDLPAMLSAYYAARGWDEATGRPKRETLQRLGLAAAADDLWGAT